MFNLIRTLGKVAVTQNLSSSKTSSLEQSIDPKIAERCIMEYFAMSALSGGREMRKDDLARTMLQMYAGQVPDEAIASNPISAYETIDGMLVREELVCRRVLNTDYVSSRLQVRVPSVGPSYPSDGSAEKEDYARSS